METSSDYRTSKQSQKIIVRAPRAPWMEFILHFGSSGLYTCYWLVKRIQELNLLTKSSFTPWLWFFVPFLLIPQLFALPKFTLAIKKLEQQNNIQSWKKNQTILWLLCVFTVAFFSDLYEITELPGWIYLAILLAWSLLFAIFQIRINRYINTLPNLDIYGSSKKYSISEWMIIVILLPLMLIGQWTKSINPFLNHEIKSFEQHTVYTDPNGYYQFPILTKGWSIVESGTVSDGTAELELQGPLTDMNYMIFFYGFDENLNSLSFSRVNYAREQLSFASCTETREFAKSHLSIFSRTICTGSILNKHSLMISTIIETEKGLYELFGQLNSVKLSFKQYRSNFISMAKGFEPL